MFTDLVIDNTNTVHVFYAFEKKVYHLEAKPKSSTVQCNYPPTITNYTGKTNVKPDEEWTGTITASDPECDKIKFYSIVKPDYVKINDHGNGTATIKAKIPQGEGFGSVGFAVFVLDEKHKETNNELSVIKYNLKLTQEGKEKGTVKVENKCTGSSKAVKNSGSTNSGNTGNANNIQQTNTQNNSAGSEVVVSKTGEGINGDCEKFIKRYEAFADRYVLIVKKVKANPTDTNAAMQLGNLMEEFGSYSTEWTNLYDCHKIPGYKERYDASTKKINDANK